MRVRTGMIGSLAAVGLLAGGLALAADLVQADCPKLVWSQEAITVDEGATGNDKLALAAAVVKVWDGTAANNAGAAVDAPAANYTIAYTYKKGSGTADTLKVTEGKIDISKWDAGTYTLTATATKKDSSAVALVTASADVTLTITAQPESNFQADEDKGQVEVPQASIKHWWGDWTDSKGTTKTDNQGNVSSDPDLTDYLTAAQSKEIVLKLGGWGAADLVATGNDKIVVVFNKGVKGEANVMYTKKANEAKGRVTGKDYVVDDNCYQYLSQDTTKKYKLEFNTWSMTPDEQSTWEIPLVDSLVADGRTVTGLRLKATNAVTAKIVSIYLQAKDQPVIKWVAKFKDAYDPNETVDLSAAAKVVSAIGGTAPTGYDIKYYTVIDTTETLIPADSLATWKPTQPAQTATEPTTTTIIAKATPTPATSPAQPAPALAKPATDKKTIKVNIAPTAEVTWTVTTTALTDGTKLAATVFNATAKKDSTALSAATFKYFLEDGTEVDTSYVFQGRYDTKSTFKVKAVLQKTDSVPYIGESEYVSFTLPVLTPATTPDQYGSKWDKADGLYLDVTELFLSGLKATCEFYEWNATKKELKLKKTDWSWDYTATWSGGQKYGNLDWSQFQEMRLSYDALTVGNEGNASPAFRGKTSVDDNNSMTFHCDLPNEADDFEAATVSGIFDATKSDDNPFVQFFFVGNRSFTMTNPKFVLVKKLTYATANLPVLETNYDNSVRVEQLPQSTTAGTPKDLTEAKLRITFNVTKGTPSGDNQYTGTDFPYANWTCVSVTKPGADIYSTGKSKGINAYGNDQVFELGYNEALALLGDTEDGLAKGFCVNTWGQGPGSGKVGDQNVNGPGYNVEVTKIEIVPLASEANGLTTDNTGVIATRHNLTWAPESATAWGTYNEEDEDDKYYPVENGTAFNAVYKTAKSTDTPAPTIKYELKAGDSWTAIGDTDNPFENKTAAFKTVTIRAIVATDAATATPRLGQNSVEFTFKVKKDPTAQEDQGALNVVNAQADVVSVEFYNLEGQKVNANAKGLLLRVEKLSNGKTNATKVIVK